MHDYYFKIKKGDLVFAFSTSDKEAFEEKLSDWMQGVTNSKSPIFDVQPDEDASRRKGFIEVKELVKINELQPEPEKNEINFDEVLEESLQNPKIEVEEKIEITTPFQAFLSVFQARNPMDYLMLTTKYLWENENADRFSIKQINAKLVPATGLSVDHATIQEAIGKELIKVVPNYTNIADVTEYTLTESGENYHVES